MSPKSTLPEQPAPMCLVLVVRGDAGPMPVVSRLIDEPVTRRLTISALDDQSMAGVIMWVPASLIFLFAAVWLAMEALNERAPLTVIAT